jgi:hypothetical protein
MPGTATTTDTVIDLTGPDDAYVEAYCAERVVAWLRSSGGSLGERAMKCAAADLIESELAAIA